MGTAASNDLRSDNDPNEPSGDLLDMSDAEIDERLRPPDQSINMSAADVEQALSRSPRRMSSPMQIFRYSRFRLQISGDWEFFSPRQLPRYGGEKVACSRSLYGCLLPISLCISQ